VPELATWTRQANHAKFDVAAVPFPDSGRPESWPSGTRMHWSGNVRDLDAVAKSLVDLLRPASLHFRVLPVLFPVDMRLPGVRIAHTRSDLVDQLNKAPTLRLIPVSRGLYADLRQSRAAVSRQDYDLGRLVRWGSSRHSQSFIALRVGRPSELAGPLATPRSLEDVVHDPLTSRIVLLLGEPGSGKTLQLRYFDACAALRSINTPESAWKANAFYVAMSEQPAQPNISLEWLAQRWRSGVDVDRWCSFEQFLADGGTILLDGLNEGGMRALPLEQWMLQWRDVIQELLERSAGRVVVTCRTRDQLIPLGALHGELPTAVGLLPLNAHECIAIATQSDPIAAHRLSRAMAGDGGLVDLYSSPFRLHAYLESRSGGVATTGARLFGLQISAAILRERDHLNFHGALIPERAAAMLATIHEGTDGDPWPVLGNIPLIRNLSALARALTIPTGPGGNAKLAAPREEAAEVLAAVLLGPTGGPVDPDLALDTAKDLHILVEERSKIRFAHPTLQHLFAAFGCSVDDVVALALGEQRQRLDAEGSGSGRADSPGSGMGPPSYTDYRYDEVYQFSAQLRGAEVPDRLVRVDPVLAARVYLSVRPEPESAAALSIIETLLSELDEVGGHRERSAIIAALGDLGWRLPGPRAGGFRAWADIPAEQWHLGLRAADERSTRGVTSQFRIIEMPTFRVSRFPVSNAEYFSFIADGGYDDKSLWTPEGWEWRVRSRTVEQFVADWGRRRDSLRRHPRRILALLRSGRASPAGAAALVRFASLQDAEIAEYARGMQARPVTVPRYWLKKAFKNPLQPVVGVSWFEANAFCEWLSRQLEANVRLASEDEWEAACLHSLGLTDVSRVDASVTGTFGNTLELGYPATTPIGSFATGTQTAQRLPVEFLGNVFEWVFDYYAPGEHSRRIVKGGSWRHEAWRAHPAYRGRGDVDAQNDDMGFRYVISEGRS
jgi:formylglycine-generating enzyme required for sulfatase activity